MACRCGFLPFVMILLAADWCLPAVPALQSDQSVYDNLPDPRLVSLLKSIAGKSGSNDVSPQEGRYLYDLIIKNKLTSGLLVSTANGYSAVWAGMALGRTGGRLLAVEPSKAEGREALMRLERAEMLGYVNLFLDDTFKVLPMLTGPFDFVFLDGRRQDYLKCFDALLPRIRPGGFLAAHNVNDQSRDLAAFIRRITGDPQLKTELVPISSAGISVTQKTASGK
jgi:predicted O-methyltransferase YrrM